jgi:hypothetical protein
MSLGGTLASLMGGGIVGLAIATSLILENTKCREQWLTILVDLLFWGTIAGGLGSLVSSSAIAIQSQYNIISDRLLLGSYSSNIALFNGIQADFARRNTI